MTPAARIAAAIEVLDAVLAGLAAEPALSRWARGNRYAGSKDRAAIRDHVFDALRRRRSYAALGGAETGRGLMIGALRMKGVAPETVFDGSRYAPAPLSAREGAGRVPEEAEALNCPDWLYPRILEDLGDDAVPVLQALGERAPVFLRVNLARGTREGAAAALAEEGIETRPAPRAAGALEVVAGARRVAASRAYGEGLVELQDASSQAVVEALELEDGARVLDYCAGGGGKSLALAARGARVEAHDADPGRMADLPARAARAGARIRRVTEAEIAGPYDLVLLDVPCSGSGSWRRDPEGKWRLSPARLETLVATQREILDHALTSGWSTRVAYVTCSILGEENAAQVEAALARHGGWRVTQTRQFLPGPEGDGFFLALFSR